MDRPRISARSSGDASQRVGQPIPLVPQIRGLSNADIARYLLIGETEPVTTRAEPLPGSSPNLALTPTQPVDSVSHAGVCPSLGWPMSS